MSDNRPISIVILVFALYACSGIAVSMVMKYADNIAKVRRLLSVMARVYVVLC